MLHCAFADDLSIAGETLGGFYTTRYVEESFDQLAAEVAARDLRGEAKFQVLRRQLTADPAITAEDLEPIDALPSRDVPLMGYAFYRTDGDEDAA